MTPERWHRITTIFHAALARESDARPAFVAQACGDDSALRREVESMIQAHRHAGTFGDAPPIAASPLEPGASFGPYCIEHRLDAGGMGEVYKARDTRLGRTVALKVVTPALAGDPSFQSRFEREARVLASLNHPHIAQVYGLEEAGGVRAIVMELVDGAALADRIARGPIRLDEALDLARQIAEALEAAHEQNIVHRDLKPANVMLRADGTAKVLDFGLARSVHRSMDPREASGSIPATASLTTPGVILGTAAYMSPEQARGKEADRRTDIWALGCVLFEMLTARPTFGGETPSDVLARVIEHEPDWKTLPARTPSAIHRLLRRCLEKDPRRRLDSAAAVRLEIDEAARESTGAVPGTAPRRGSVWRALAWAAVGGGATVLVTMTPAGRADPPDAPRPATATSVFLARGLPLATPGVHFAIAPDGTSVVFAGNYGGQRVLYRRGLDQVEPEPVVGTEGGSDVFFSPDGRSLGFETRSELWAIPIDGGSPQRLAPNQPLRGGTWGAEGRLVVGRVGSGLWLIRTATGESRQLTVPEQGERHELPQMLPGGRAVLFTIVSSSEPPSAALYLFARGETRRLFEGVGARFVSSGHVVFGRQGKLWAVAFDPESLRTVGAARPIRDDVLWSAAAYPQFAVEADLLVYVRSSQPEAAGGRAVLQWKNRQGTTHVLPLQPNNYMLPRWSPDGDRFVVQLGANRDLWTYDVGRGTLTRLTSDRVIAYSAPAWTPDGSRVVFTTWFDGTVGLGWVPSDGSGPVEVLVKDVGLRSFERTHPVLLPDASGVIMTALAPGAAVEDLLFVPLAGERRLRAVFPASGVERNPTIAPDGRFVAYNSDDSGRSEVYVRPFPNAATRQWQISSDGGAGPMWTRGGREIVYLDGERRIVAVAVRQSGGAELDFSQPEPLFSVGGTDVIGFGLDRGWDVTADGERFLSAVNERGMSQLETVLELTLIHNWTEELKRLVPPQGQ